MFGAIQGKDILSEFKQANEESDAISIWSNTGDPWSSQWIFFLLCRVFITVALTYLNYRGLNTVGSSSIALAGIGLLPFIVCHHNSSLPINHFQKQFTGMCFQ